MKKPKKLKMQRQMTLEADEFRRVQTDSMIERNWFFGS